MSKSDVFMIISQIYVVGAFLSEKHKSFLNVFGFAWMLLSFVAWGVK